MEGLEGLEVSRASKGLGLLGEAVEGLRVNFPPETAPESLEWARGFDAQLLDPKP